MPPEAASAWIAINAIRALAMDAVEQAQSGHPGTPMALAPAAFVLWTRFLKYNPRNPAWADRDRFVLSCGHASMLQYAVLHLAGYDLPLDEIRRFRQWGSRTPGHPERGHPPGIEVTTGPLGQGVANAVGMAIAERLLAERFNRPGLAVVDHRVWAFVSDGDIMEGVASEAASIAGHLRLDKLTLVYDDNRITIDGSTSLTFSEDVARRFEAYGWHVVRVAGDGNDLDAIAAALDAARTEGGRPSLVILRTHIADPAPTKRDTPEAHGAPLGAEEVRRTKEIMGWPVEPAFYVPEAAYEPWRPSAEAGAGAEAAWRDRLTRYRTEHPADSAELARRLAGDLPAGWERALPAVAPAKGLATRQASGQVLSALADILPELAGGSADLAASTATQLKQVGTLGPGSAGREIHWGIREHAMAGALNGIAAHGGLRPFGSTFLVFTDYMKPAIRLAAMMGLPVIYVGTHDSIGLGEDGPTHQPIEQLAMLRAIPGIRVLRPADATETVEAWRAAIEHRSGPTILVLTRQKVPVLDRTRLAPASGLARGGYVLWDPPGGPEAILVATGSEVHVALAAAERLLSEGIRARVVSLPSWELFEAQPAEYRESVLPRAIRARVGIEAASPFGWLRYVTEDGVMLAMESFGASAPGERLFSEFHFTPEQAAAAVRRLLGRAGA